MKGMLMLVLLYSLALAVTKEDVDKVVSDAAAIVRELKAEELLKEAKGVIVCPGVIKSALVVGVSAGKCVASIKDPKVGGWSAPAFYKLAQASLGFQLGVESIDLVLVVKTERGVRSLLKTRVKLGGDVSLAAGPVGRSASASTDIALKADIYSYSKAKGVFAGVSLQGGALIPDEDSIRAYYGRTLTAKQVLYEKVKASSSASVFKVLAAGPAFFLSQLTISASVRPPL
ncbi:MAG: lipid-binding SYLF domain-containing protein [Aquificaceae bacterium]